MMKITFFKTTLKTTRFFLFLSLAVLSTALLFGEEQSQSKSSGKERLKAKRRGLSYSSRRNKSRHKSERSDRQAANFDWRKKRRPEATEIVTAPELVGQITPTRYYGDDDMVGTHPSSWGQDENGKILHKMTEDEKQEYFASPEYRQMMARMEQSRLEQERAKQQEQELVEQNEPTLAPEAIDNDQVDDSSDQQQEQTRQDNQDDENQSHQANEPEEPEEKSVPEPEETNEENAPEPMSDNERWDLQRELSQAQGILETMYLGLRYGQYSNEELISAQDRVRHIKEKLGRP